MAQGVFDGLNDEARRVLYAMVETGMRPSEIVNIAPDNIRLDAEIPHVRIIATGERGLKTRHANRDNPLVGVSLMAFEAQRGGFPSYRDREAGLSAAINKFLKTHALRPEPGQSLYSLRHSFEDRLIAARADERMRSELMGHAYKREKYGHGPSLAMKREILENITLTPPAEV